MFPAQTCVVLAASPCNQAPVAYAHPRQPPREEAPPIHSSG